MSSLANLLISVCCLAAVATGCSGDDDAASGDDASGGSAPLECEGRAEAYEPGMRKASDDGSLDVELVSAEPPPPASADTTWSLVLRDAGGSAIEGAAIVALPYMVDHGHTAPTRIAVESGGGTYELGPLGLIMPGLWEVTLQVTPSPGAPDEEVVFDFCIGG